MAQAHFYCSRCGGVLTGVSFWCDNCDQDSEGNPTPKEIHEATTIADRIIVAFSGVQLGIGMTINEARREGVFDAEHSQLSVRGMDLERNWIDVPGRKCEKLYPALYAFDADGWKFYLPAFMCWTLHNWRKSDSPTPEWLIGSLKHRVGFANHFNTLTVTQAKAVLSFLDFCKVYIDEDTAADAINTYWSQFR